MSCACLRALTKDWCLGFSVGLVFALSLWLLSPVRPCCVLRAHALTKEPQEPWLFGRFGVRFVFVVVVACSSLLCLARARAH